jgi:hypothetical protein
VLQNRSKVLDEEIEGAEEEEVKKEEEVVEEVHRGRPGAFTSTTTTRTTTNYYDILKEITTGNYVNPNSNKLASTIAQAWSLLVETRVGEFMNLVDLAT